MERALWIAASGMKGQAEMSDAIAHNLANVNTTGYKRGNVHFQDLFYQNASAAGAGTTGNDKAAGVDFGYGARVASISKNYAQGNLKATGGEVDLAVMGDGFFEVTLPTGESAFTRDGNFSRNAAGQIVTSDGYLVVGFPNVSKDSTNVTIAEDGTVSQTVNGTTTSLGSLQISRFPNREGLRPLGQNLYAETPSSGTATPGTPGTNGAGFIRQGYLEGSNVEIVNEMVDMIASQRAFEIISKSIKSTEEMMRLVNNLKG